MLSTDAQKLNMTMKKMGASLDFLAMNSARTDGGLVEPLIFGPAVIKSVVSVAMVTSSRMIELPFTAYK